MYLQKKKMKHILKVTDYKSQCVLVLPLQLLSKLVYIVKINLTFIACFIKQFALYSQKHLPVNFSLKNTPREHPAEITGFLFCYSYQQTWLLLLLFLWTFFLLLLLYGLI